MKESSCSDGEWVWAGKSPSSKVAMGKELLRLRDHTDSRLDLTIAASGLIQKEGREGEAYEALNDVVAGLA